jgi:glutamine phosphoribosylpyrophosphate amidotransferase
MCGIIYAKNLIDNHPVSNLVKILYQNQKERGQQGFGFVGLNKEQISTYRATDEKGIIKYLNDYQHDEIIFHHRLPTSTSNTIKSTHPFIIDVENKRYYFMHNGIIQNADKLKEKHSKKGYCICKSCHRAKRMGKGGEF